jgi:hypothetical protein
MTKAPPTSTPFVKLDSNGRLAIKVKNLDDLPDEIKSAIVKLKERHNEDGTVTIEVEMADKIAALDRLGKSIGLFKEKSESTVHHHIEVVDPMSRILDRLNALKNALDADAPADIEPPVRRPQLPGPPQTATVRLSTLNSPAP